MPKRETILRWLPPVLWMGVIFFASSLPGAELAGVSAYSTLGHLGEYLILGVLLFVAARRTPPLRRAALFTIAVASVYGMTDEIHQFFTPGRTPDPRDWAADTVGATLGVLLIIGIAAARRKRD